MTDQDEPEDRPTEGVRIIGAQEAAEAAARPDVVQRRRGTQKKYGDRPDRPAPASDLPKITISTSESPEGRHPDPAAAPPEAERSGGEPRWADDDASRPAYGEGSDREGFGHARIVADDQMADDEMIDDEPDDDLPDDDLAAPGRVGDDLADPEPEPEPAADPSGGLGEPYASVGEPEEESMGDWAASDEPTFEGADPYGDDPDGAPEPVGSSYDDGPPEEEPYDGPGSFVASDGEEVFYGDPPPPADDGDDSFVLPHWTEPPTGQVPKVVAGEGAPEPEPLATYGSQPRWRDEGERTSVTDFDDLVDDGPRLGALGGDVGETDDDFFSSDPFGQRHDEDLGTDVYDEDYEDDYDDYDEDYADELEPEWAEDDDLDAVAGPPVRPRRRPRDAGDEGGSEGGDRPIGVAVAVGVGLVAVGLLCFYLGALTTTLLATVVVTIAAFEYFNAVRERGHNPATLLGLVAVTALMIATYAAGLAAYPVVIGLLIITGLLWYLWVAPGERSVQNLGLTLLGVMWVGFLGSFATLFLGLGKVLEDSREAVTSNVGIGVLIAAVIAAVSHDVGAYFVGRYVGRTPLSAASPNKTQEGLIGGVVSSLFVTFVLVGVIGIAPVGDELAQAFVFALLSALVAPLGDLCESFVKRDLGIKDMGSVLPGHGGVLDRFDALLFVLPVAYFVTVLFDLWAVSGS